MLELRKPILLLAAILAVGVACRKPHGGRASTETAAQSGADAKAAEAPAPNVPDVPSDEQLEAQHRGDDDDDFGGGGNQGWVPAEFKKGAARWKDTGVYLDGRPVGMLAFGELPVTLKPVWIEDRVSAEKRPGSDDPGWRLVKERQYRFDDYLKALGINLKKVKEVHVYGPKLTNTIVVSGKEVIARGAGFRFRFGGEVSGKAIPVVPPHFGNGKSPDKISGVMVYIDKKPPELIHNEGILLDGEFITGVPYYGEPLRGGVRVYLDDRLVTVIKRKLLEDTKLGEKGPNGETRWKLFSFLASQGIDTSTLVEAWVIRDERRKEKLTKNELVDATFEASSQAKGQVLLGVNKSPANVIALHTKPVRPDQLPQILPDEDIN